jgi:hypothetical protein
MRSTHIKSHYENFVSNDRQGGKMSERIHHVHPIQNAEVFKHKLVSRRRRDPHGVIKK